VAVGATGRYGRCSCRRGKARAAVAMANVVVPVIELLSSDDEAEESVPQPKPVAPPTTGLIFDLTGADNDGEAGAEQLAATTTARFAALVAEVDDSLVGLGLAQPAQLVQELEPGAKRQKMAEDGHLARLPTKAQLAAAAETEAKVRKQELMGCSAAALRCKCRELSLRSSGNKSMLVARILAGAPTRGTSGGGWASGTGFGGLDSYTNGGASANAEEDWRATSETLTQQRLERKLSRRLRVLRQGLPRGSFAPDILPKNSRKWSAPGSGIKVSFLRWLPADWVAVAVSMQPVLIDSLVLLIVEPTTGHRPPAAPAAQLAS
jgi:hypothetical protein